MKNWRTRKEEIVDELRYYPTISLEGLKKTKEKKLRYDSIEHLPNTYIKL
jgi:hypothetical protein